MNLKKSSLAVAVTGAIALAAAGQASASVYGGSKLDLQNLQIFITQDGVNPSPNAPITSFEFTATNTATLNGVSSPVQSADCGGTPGSPGVGTNDCNAALPRLDPTAANAPGGTINRANNDFSLFGPGLNQYANSDSVIQQAELTFDGPTQTHQIAETELQTGASARANAEITSNTGFSFAFTLATPGELILSFEADPYLRAVINQGSNFVNGNAQANINFTVSLTNNNTGDSITWSPQGTAFNDCSVDGGLVGVACSETADGQDLNRNLSVTSNPSDVQHSTAVGFSAFGIDITGLTAGDYTFALNAVTSTSVRQTVPEPATLALLGVGLIGIGAAKRRDGKRA